MKTVLSVSTYLQNIMSNNYQDEDPDYIPPNLPGYTFKDPRPENFKPKHQYFVVSNNGLMFAHYPPKETVQKDVTEHRKRTTLNAPTMKYPETFPDSETYTQTVLAGGQTAAPNPVLRFYAYFRQDIVESAEETERVRYVRIHIYLEDNSIMIAEDHIRNSGMNQGVLLSRQRVLNPSIKPYGQQYVASDFNVGINVEMAGITYHIYDCDEFTRKYFQEAGVELNPIEQPPDDLYSIKRKITEKPIRVTRVNTDKTNLKRFLDYDGKVLRFYATWDDTGSMFGEKRKFVIHYFLVDGTIEIRQVLPPNSGRVPVSQFLKKAILKKPGTDEPYTDADLRIGSTVDVFGRPFIIYDVDKFTRDFIDQRYGKQDWTPETVTGTTDMFVADSTPHEPAPYNGWGDEEDSLGYCTSLHPQPPKKDIMKLINKEGQVLRFSAHFLNPAPQDAARKFVISYYMADDTIAIFEMPQRNSGFREGKFIQRGKYKKKDGSFYTASDLSVGTEITINSFTFVTDNADEYAFNYMEADDFPQSDLFEIISQIKNMNIENI